MTVLPAYSSQGSTIMEDQFEKKRSFLYKNIQLKSPNLIRENESVEYNQDLRGIIPPIVSEKIDETNCNNKIYDFLSSNAFETENEFADTQACLSKRSRSIQEAKNAFLISTISQGVNNETPFYPVSPVHEKIYLGVTKSPVIGVKSKSEDSRVTGGGEECEPKADIPGEIEVNNCTNVGKEFECKVRNKRLEEVQAVRKVSFKVKNFPPPYRRTGAATTTTRKTTTLNSNKVTELTNKFNEMVKGNDSILKTPKFAKAIEYIQNNKHKTSTSTSSSISSTVSSNLNVKIILKHKNSVKRHNLKKKCSSVDSIDKLSSHESLKQQRKVNRTKSDGVQKGKTSKHKSPCSGNKESVHSKISCDVVDGVKCADDESEVNKKPVSRMPPARQISLVKEAIQKFETGMAVQKPTKSTEISSTVKPLTENTAHHLKPKIPEKKCSVTLTKNVVLRDGKPKIKTLKQTNTNQTDESLLAKLEPIQTEEFKVKEKLRRKGQFYEKSKFKTNYIHSDKLSLKAVEIINDLMEQTLPILEPETDTITTTINDDEKHYQELSVNLRPNESFLWGCKTLRLSSADSNTGIYKETLYESPTAETYFDASSDNVSFETINQDPKDSQGPEVQSLVEAINETICNNEVTVANEGSWEIVDDCEQVKEQEVEAINLNFNVGENDYELLEPVEDQPLISTKSGSRINIMNLPLPEIPLDPGTPVKKEASHENIYQCLLEMRSHPEGDECSIHSYEFCENNMEERTRGDGDSDDGYEYCRSPNLPPVASPESEHSAETIKPLPPKRIIDSVDRRIAISKSASTTSTISYEKIGEPCIYEKIPPRPYKPKDLLNISPSRKRDSLISTDTRNYNDGENIYDIIKHPDGVSLSNCYESIPNSPHSVVKLRDNPKTRYVSGVNKRLSYDTVSNVSQYTASSDQKTNSIYGQRSVISFGGQEITFQVPNSEISVSDRSDHSDDWVDISDPEEDKTNDSTIIIVERGRGRKSPISWSQKVRDQWLKSPKHIRPTNDGDSSDSGHYYESLNVDAASRGAAPSLMPIDDDFDSFDSDSEDELPVERPNKNDSGVDLENTRLPDPPPSNIYTLTKFASAAGKKMRELKRNFTRKYSASAESNKTGSKSPPANGLSKTKPKQQSEGNIYQNMYYPEPVLQNRNSIPQIVKKSPPPIINTNKTDPPTPPIASVYDVAFNRELKNAINEKKINGSTYGNIAPPDSQKISPYVQLDMSKGKDSGTLSRKTYFSFKSRFRRCSSMAIDINSVPSALKITNSTFYLTDSIDGDSGFSNCSDSGQIANGGSSEALQPILPTRKRTKATETGSDKPLVNNHQHTKYESSPNLSAYNMAITEDRHKYIVRPMSPPPPPPDHHTAMNAELKRLLPTLARKDKRPGNRTSWYAEAGVGDPNDALKPVSNGAKDRPSSTSWYAEVGLYQAGNISTSSGASSGASDPASLPATPTPKHYGLFTQEPLYQFYNADKVKSACQNMTDSDSDGYEEVRLMMIKKKAEMQECRPSAMALVSPHKGPSRTLWSEIPEVLNSAVLSSLSAKQRKLQEAKFEIVTSEASYLNSLNVLESHFVSHPAFQDENILCKTDRDILFGSIIPVKRCSQAFMNELEKCWQENILLHGLCDIVKQHAEKHFDVYIKYCENQIFLVKAMQRLKAKGCFNEVLSQMENHQACQSLSLHSFLMLPMQRATRLPLLMDAVLKHLDPADNEYQSCMDALATLNHFVSQCNEGARNMERVEEMYRITSSIEFPAHMKQAPELGPSCSLPSRAPSNTPRGTIGASRGAIGAPRRWLVRSGELTQLVWRGDEQLKLTFGKKFQKNPLWLFLFTDLLVITKKRSEDSYVVVDYCQRSLIEMSSGDVMSQLHVKETSGKHVMLLTLLENYENKTVEMLMSCSTETDRQRWMEAFAAPSSSNPEETVYAGWDCPQVAALFPYSPSQPDELALHEGDIVNVNKKMMDGWYHGERIRDGEVGWFPGNYTIEIASAHVRARNLRQRYRLLALSGTYLGQKKKTT